MIEYKVLDINTYPRKAHLEYFMTMMQPQFDITSEVDITELKDYCRKKGCSFFLTFLHVVALSADSVPELRRRIHRIEGAGKGTKDSELSMPEYGIDYEVREYSEGPTSHTESTGNELYCYCALHHHMPWDEYINVATGKQKTARDSGTLEEDKEIEAFYFVSCVPWLHYSEVVHPMIDKYDSNPKISWGKYKEDFRGRFMMPLTLAAHHGLVDGIHVAKFYDNIEKNMKLLTEGKL